jgi:hypothetical protein
VKPILRLLLVCFLMLALPFQAVASAGMLPGLGLAPASVREAPAAEPPPCHQQRAMADHHASARTAPSHDGDAFQHTKGKCGSCAACYVGAALAPSLPAALALAPPCTVSIPFRAGHLPSVDPVLPERPPSTLPA